jgi:hypothetical protein
VYGLAFAYMELGDIEPRQPEEIRGHRDRQKIPECLAGRGEMPFRGQEI